MANLLKVLLFMVLAYIDCSMGQLSRDPEELLNWCLNSQDHKHKPGKEDFLHKQCTPWKDHACCTSNITVDIHEIDMYNFTFDHCVEQTGKKMSSDCRRHFIKDNCFYHCEPHIGLWVVETSRKIAKERFHKVPLCASECEVWFEDCKDDFTCAHNWPRDFKFSKGRNTCKENADCITFQTMYGTAKDFCENVWDESWKYTPNTEPCMHVWFDGFSENPNKKVAEIYIDRYLNSAYGISLNFWLICLLLFTSSKISIF